MLKKSNKISLEEATRLAILGKLPLKESKEVSKKVESTTVSTTQEGLTTVETDDANIVIEPKDNSYVEDVCDIPVDTPVNEPVEDLPAVVPEDLPAEEITSDETIDEPIEESKVVEGKKIEEGEAPLFKKKINKTDIKKVESKDKGLKKHKVAFKSSNKLQEGVYAYEYIGTFNELYETSWGQAKRILDEIAEAGKEEELMDYLEEYGSDPENAIDRTSLNDLLAYDWEIVFEALGINEDEDEDEDLDESKKVTEETNLEPITSSIDADSCKVNGDIVTGSAELVQYDGSEYNPVSDEFTFEYNRKDKTIKVTSDNKKEIVKDLDEEEIINNLEDNILPEITKTTEGKDTKVESKEAPLFKKKINKTDMKKVEDKEPKKHIINKVDLRKTESKEARIARIKESIERHKVQEAKAKKNEALKGKIEEGLTRFLKETYKNGKEIKIESIIRLKENRLFAKGSLVMENSTKKFSCSLVPVKEGKTFRSYTIKENKLLKIEEGKTSKGKSFNLIVRK